MKASSAPAVKLTNSASSTTEKQASVSPKASASPSVILPIGIGRDWVRFITRSMSASYHMLSAPEAPAPMAMHSSAVKPRTGWIDPGASIMPTNAVKMTSDITRGFSSAR